MKQRTAFLMASGLITFIIVLISAVGVSLFFRAVYPANAAIGAPTLLAAPTESAEPLTPVQPAQAGLSVEEATQIALQLIPGAQVTGEPRLVEANGTQAYVVMTNVALVAVEATTGEVLGVQMLGPFEGEGEEGEHESGEHEQHEFNEPHLNPTRPTSPESPTIDG